MWVHDRGIRSLEPPVPLPVACEAQRVKTFPNRKSSDTNSLPTSVSQDCVDVFITFCLSHYHYLVNVFLTTEKSP